MRMNMIIVMKVRKTISKMIQMPQLQPRLCSFSLSVFCLTLMMFSSAVSVVFFKV